MGEAEGDWVVQIDMDDYCLSRHILWWQLGYITVTTSLVSFQLQLSDRF